MAERVLNIRFSKIMAVGYLKTLKIGEVFALKSAKALKCRPIYNFWSKETACVLGFYWFICVSFYIFAVLSSRFDMLVSRIDVFIQ